MPTILDDHTFPGGEQTQTTEITTGISTCPGRCLLEWSKLLESGSTSSIHDKIQRERRFLVVSPKKKKSSSVGKRHSKVGASRSNKGLHRRSSVSFPIVHAQFSALPVEDRLEFLSWLFEGALSHYICTSLSTDATVSRCIANQYSDITLD